MRTPCPHIVILIAFLINSLGPIPAVQAADFQLPVPGIMVRLSPSFSPPILKGLKVHPDDPFKFEFILDKGDEGPQEGQLKREASTLIKYFLTGLTIPEKDLWVNLSPYEKDRIIPHSFGLTEMGRDLLAEDYMLKQITASLIYPEGAIGKRFWKKIYAEAQKRFNTTDIPVNTFNKVWIVPEKAVVYENVKAGTAYVVESKLKVMLEQDYLSLEKHGEFPGSSNVSAIGSQVVREIVIPELTKEVNEDKNFSQLRQVYNSLILATWYKKKIKDSILEQVYADKSKTAGVQYTSTVIPEKAKMRFKDDVEGLYKEYLVAFKKGVYNYIKEEIDPVTREMTPRKYFSGGADLNLTTGFKVTESKAMIADALKPTERIHEMIISVAMNAMKAASSPAMNAPYQKPHVALGFGIADVKVPSHGPVKILEFGNGLGSSFRGYDKVNNPKSMLENLWVYLSKLGLPIMYVAGGEFDGDSFVNMKARSFKNLDMRIFDSEQALLSLQAGGWGRKRDDFDPHNLSTYSAVLIFRSNSMNPQEVRELLKRYPWIIGFDLGGGFLNYVDDKVLTKSLFTGSSLQASTPSWKLLPRVYSEKTVQDVIKTMPAQYYVIKPPNQSTGTGIIIVSAEELENTLKKVLPFPVLGNLDSDKNSLDPVSYWQNTPTPVVLIEALEHSKPVEVADKKYDPTLRVAYVVERDRDRTSVKILDGYWKLPVSPMGEADMQHVMKSESYKNEEPAKPLTGQDRTEIFPQLARTLELAMDQILSVDDNGAIDKILFSDNTAEQMYAIHKVSNKVERITDREWQRMIELSRKSTPVFDTAFIQMFFNLGKSWEKMSLEAQENAVQLLTIFLEKLTDPQVFDRAVNAMLRVLKHDTGADGKLHKAFIAYLPDYKKVSDKRILIDYLYYLHEDHQMPAEEFNGALKHVFESSNGEVQNYILERLFEGDEVFNADWILQFVENDETIKALWLSKISKKYFAHPLDIGKTSGKQAVVQKVAADEQGLRHPTVDQIAATIRSLIKFHRVYPSRWNLNAVPLKDFIDFMGIKVLETLSGGKVKDFLTLIDRKFYGGGAVKDRISALEGILKDRAMNTQAGHGNPTRVIFVPGTGYNRNNDMIELISSQQFEKETGIDVRQGAVTVFDNGVASGESVRGIYDEMQQLNNPRLRLKVTELRSGVPAAYISSDLFLKDGEVLGILGKRMRDNIKVKLLVDENYEIHEAIMQESNGRVTRISLSEGIISFAYGKPQELDSSLLKVLLGKLSHRDLTPKHLREMIESGDNLESGPEFSVQKNPLQKSLSWMKGVELEITDFPHLENLDSPAIVLFSHVLDHYPLDLKEAYMEKMKKSLRDKDAVVIKDHDVRTGSEVVVVYQKRGEELVLLGRLRISNDGLRAESEGVMNFAYDRTRLEKSILGLVKKRFVEEVSAFQLEYFSDRIYKIIDAEINRLGKSDEEVLDTILDLIQKEFQDQWRIQVTFTSEERRAILELSNSAMSADHGQASVTERGLIKNGGIDLTPANMNIQVKTGSRTGLLGDEVDGIKFHLNPAMIAQFQNSAGFTPVIINMQPMTNLSKFLGLENGQNSKTIA